MPHRVNTRRSLAALLNTRRPGAQRARALIRDVLLLASVFALGASRVHAQTPATTRYIVYLPPRNIELLGVDSVDHLTTLNRVDLRGIVRHFEADGFTVISHVRSIRSPWDSADSTVADVRAILASGVPAANVTLLGQGKGGTIALIAAAKLGLPALNVVAMAPCTNEMLESMKSHAEVKHLVGRLLFLRVANDTDTESCRPLFDRVVAPSSVTENVLPTGVGAVEFSIVRESWVAIVSKWARGG